MKCIIPISCLILYNEYYNNFKYIDIIIIIYLY